MNMQNQFNREETHWRDMARMNGRWAWQDRHSRPSHARQLLARAKAFRDVANHMAKMAEVVG